jgi:hypothetical protein
MYSAKTLKLSYNHGKRLKETNLREINMSIPITGT